jgi:hypothetical protein
VLLLQRPGTTALREQICYMSHADSLTDSLIHSLNTKKKQAHPLVVSHLAVSHLQKYARSLLKVVLCRTWYGATP